MVRYLTQCQQQVTNQIILNDQKPQNRLHVPNVLKGSELVLDCTWLLGGASSPTDFPLISYWARGEWAWEGAWAQVLGDQGSSPGSVIHQLLSLTDYMVRNLKINLTAML